MANFQDIIKLVEHDNGKVFVVDEEGEVKLVMLKVEDYQRFLLGKLKQGIKDIEAINREITKAQLADDMTVVDLPADVPAPQAKVSDVPRPPVPDHVDLRSEVIDPNFNFDAAPGEEYESIKPEFEDI
jgi:hypothetical protein